MALTKIPSSLLDTSGGFDLQGNITLGDNERIQFGDGTDFEIYSDGGSNNYLISNNGALILRNLGDDKDIYLQSDDGSGGFTSYIHAKGSTGEVILKHYGSNKIATSSTGATVTGNLAVTGDLDITGNINSYNVTDLDVTDQTITLGAGQTEANSGGSGIIIDGSSASILWNETNDVFDINKGLNVDGTSQFTIGSGENVNFYRSANSNFKIELGSVNSDLSSEGQINIKPEGTTTAKYQLFSNTFFINGPDVGIGTNSPDSKLTVNVTTNSDGIELQSSEVKIATLARTLVDSQVVASLDGVASRPIHIGGIVNEDVILANAGGNVGIGTSSPGHKLDVEGGNNVFDIARFGSSASDNSEVTIGYFDANATNGIPGLIEASDFGGLIQGGENGHLVLGIRDNDTSDALDIVSGGGNFMSDSTYDTLVATFKATGNVGIGTTHPAKILEIFGSGSENGILVKNDTNTNYRGYYIGSVESDNTAYGKLHMDVNSGELNITSGYSGWGGFITLDTSGAERMRISATDITLKPGNGTVIVDGGTADYEPAKVELQGRAFGGDITAKYEVSDGGAVFFGSTTNHSVRFIVNNTEKLRLDGSHILLNGGNQTYSSNQRLYSGSESITWSSSTSAQSWTSSKYLPYQKFVEGALHFGYSGNGAISQHFYISLMNHYTGLSIQTLHSASGNSGSSYHTISFTSTGAYNSRRIVVQNTPAGGQNTANLNGTIYYGFAR